MRQGARLVGSGSPCFILDFLVGIRILGILEFSEFFFLTPPSISFFTKEGRRGGVPQSAFSRLPLSTWLQPGCESGPPHFLQTKRASARLLDLGFTHKWMISRSHPEGAKYTSPGRSAGEKKPTSNSPKAEGPFYTGYWIPACAGMTSVSFGTICHVGRGLGVRVNRKRRKENFSPLRLNS
jgi:hypothetical protein